MFSLGLFKEGKCYYKPSMAAAFVKEVRNITAVNDHRHDKKKKTLYESLRK